MTGSIGSNTFVSTKVSFTELPSGITDLEYYCFGGCTELAIKELPKGITHIGALAFVGCTKITELTVNSETPPTLDNTNAFNSNVIFYVPDASLDAYKAATNWSQLNIKAISERPT